MEMIYTSQWELHNLATQMFLTNGLKYSNPKIH